VSLGRSPVGWQTGAMDCRIRRFRGPHLPGIADIDEERRPMKSPADMKIVMLDITNSCHKRCSNFCPGRSIKNSNRKLKMAMSSTN